MSPTIVSAPGKVLIAGGYLVLDPVYSGLVISTSSRFYTVIESLGNSPFKVQVQSPQFLDAIWNYEVNVDVPRGAEVEQAVHDTSEPRSGNKFVHLALQRTLALILEMEDRKAVRGLLCSGLKITILGGNDFYSQRAQLAERNLPPTIASLSLVPEFAPSNVTIGNVHKTGLGSSAALITSLVCALLVHFDVIPKSSVTSSETVNDGKALVHNLAQYIHCLAQGKVGSGFDVSVAVFGSQIYTRFDPVVLQSLMEDSSLTMPLLPIVSPSNTSWTHKVQDFGLPPLTRMMLADVDAGSDTPSFVGKVLKWVKGSPDEAAENWTALSKLNQLLGRTLQRLTTLHSNDPQVYEAVISRCASLTHAEWHSQDSGSQDGAEVIKNLVQVHTITQDIRTKMRQMGEMSGTPIEPKEQTALLDACVSKAGVLGGGVPGAGGYDAVYVLVLAPPEAGAQTPADRVEQVWQGWKELDVSPLAAEESREKGVRLEQLSDVKGLKRVLES
ncbi:hypothetical protein BOTBODRAFT_168955 [Botryobasidium botryosum FD-172 SS1]|uniref:Phosphomevalonate kinase n=1 Tax=Botryobasidium botryosum (strain FD-172 SS1) TaxID=930990 RepID=A0A067N1K1_BOTB1|nr:hypothetical protein BOTBODRAFT_168955 [Botryobasidium botryosum FD-172 SS1]